LSEAPAQGKSAGRKTVTDIGKLFDVTCVARTLTQAFMKIATCNVNGIRARLPLLLDWLEEQVPDTIRPRNSRRRRSCSPSTQSMQRAMAWCGMGGRAGTALQS